MGGQPFAWPEFVDRLFVKYHHGGCPGLIVDRLFIGRYLSDVLLSANRGKAAQNANLPGSPAIASKLLRTFFG